MTSGKRNEERKIKWREEEEIKKTKVERSVMEMIVWREEGKKKVGENAERLEEKK